MTLVNQIRRIERIHFLIRTKATGTPAELAHKLRVSESQLYHLLKILREDFNAPVYYSKKDQCYCYETDVQFLFGFEPVLRAS